MSNQFEDLKQKRIAVEAEYERLRLARPKSKYEKMEELGNELSRTIKPILRQFVEAVNPNCSLSGPKAKGGGLDIPENTVRWDSSEHYLGPKVDDEGWKTWLIIDVVVDEQMRPLLTRVYYSKPGVIEDKGGWIECAVDNEKLISTLRSIAES